MANKKEMAYRYDSSAEVYDNRYNDIQVHKFQEILSRLDIEDKEFLLDIGCGTGNFLGWHFNNGLGQNTFGIDISFEMIKLAHEKYPEINFLVADADNLPFRDSFFDNLFSITHLQNMPDPLITLIEMNRIAKDDAKITISILKKSWTLDKLTNLIEKIPMNILEKWIAKIEDVGVICEKC
ncbi:MAG: methyltransferase domain-containing protein [Asgard group archaeon]|nr:methyltransferase domain-containing protein [Asgard group archaeon]